MTPPTSAFVVLVVLVVLAPGLDLALVLRATVVGGRRRGAWTAAGIGLASAAQGLAVALGLGAVITSVHPLFLAVKWVGVAYLLWLGVQALRAALRRDNPPTEVPTPGRGAWAGLRQGALCNLTNPKIIAFFLALLPQFVSPDASLLTWVAHAWLLPAIGTAWLMLVVLSVGALRRVLLRSRVRRSIDAVTGVVLLGLGARLASERG